MVLLRHDGHSSAPTWIDLLHRLVITQMRLIQFAILLISILPSTDGRGSTFFLDNNVSLPITNDDINKAKSSDWIVYIGDQIFYISEIQAKAAFVVNLWTDGILVYEFDSNITEDQKSKFIAACEAWTVNTPVRCAIRTNQNRYIHVATHFGGGSECGGFPTSCSAVGMTVPGQKLWVYVGQWNDPRTLQHEIGHAFGLIHEHQRPDRDQYVFYYPKNGQANSESQFVRFSGNLKVSTQYDFISIMHYPNCAFSAAACTSGTPATQTLVPRACNLDFVGGNSISALDFDGIRKAYAPALQALMSENRDPSCGTYTLSPDQVSSACGTNCKEASPVTYNKTEQIYKKWCSFVPVQYPEAMCIPIRKTYIGHHWDSDPFSCGFLHVDTRTELWVDCGCPLQKLDAKCVNLSGLSGDNLGKEPDEFEDWRSGRLVYFDQIMKGLVGDGLLASDVIDQLGSFYQLNFLDRKFETKFARARAGIFSYAHWRNSIQPDYVLDLVMFRKITAYRKLRSN